MLFRSIPGCDPNIRNYSNLTPLHCAARNSQGEYVKFCIEYNKKCIRREKFNFNAVGGRNQYSILHYLVIHSTLEVISDVLSYGVNVLAKDSYGRTPRDMFKHSIGRKLLLRFEKIQRYNDLVPVELIPIDKKVTQKMSQANLRALLLKNEKDSFALYKPNIKSKFAVNKQTSSDNIPEGTNTPRISEKIMRKPVAFKMNYNMNDNIGIEEDKFMTHQKNIKMHLNLFANDRNLMCNKYRKIYQPVDSN